MLTAPAQVSADTLVEAVEVWRPDASGRRLEWFAGAYGPHPEAADSRQGRSCGVGEGLVGEALAAGAPLVSRASDDAREELAPIRISYQVAIPAVRGGVCRGVVQLHCNDSEDRQGAFELWRPNDRGELALAGGWYANLERFGLISKHVKFPKRAGLPGKVWEDRFPRVMGSLGTSQDFVRAAGAKAEGLSTALGIPVMKSALGLDTVLVLLSAARSPIAHVMEVWALDPESNSLRIVSADYGPYVDLAPASRRRRLRSGEGVAGRVFRDGAPWVTRDLVGVEFPRGQKFSEYGFEWCLGYPVFVGDELLAVVTLVR